jgi:hypothetical protein
MFIEKKTCDFGERNEYLPVLDIKELVSTSTNRKPQPSFRKSLHEKHQPSPYWLFAAPRF